MKLLFFLISGIIAASADQSQVLKEFSVGNNLFAGNVYKELLKTEPGNFLICPLSAEIILALVYNGARGKTAQELASGLHLPEDKEKIQQAIQDLTPHLEGSDKYILNSANKIYIKDGSRIQEEFKNIAVDIFKTDIQTIDFNNNVQAAAKINQWAQEKTHNKIRELVKKDDFDALTRTVLVNAMYFHGKWIHEFPARATRQQTFYSPNTKISVAMMQQATYLKYFESSELQTKFLELPYEGNDITMTIALPNAKDGLSALETRISDVLVDHNFSGETVAVSLPKFEIKTTIEYVPIMKNLGIVEPFLDTADFSEILEGEALKISKVIQKTFIEVEEKGTIASAATAVELPIPISADYEPPSVIEFVADHPFIYYIKIKDIIFFVGRYNGV